MREPDRLKLGAGAQRGQLIAWGMAAIGLALSLVLGFGAGDGFRRFYFAYLVAFCFILSIAVGALAFVLLQHLTRAGWSVNVRRVGETLAATLPALGVMSVPILVSVAMQRGLLYPWAVPVGAAGAVGHGGLSDVVLAKRALLNPAFFIARIVFYFVVWSGIAWWYWRTSTRQDKTLTPALSRAAADSARFSRSTGRGGETGSAELDGAARLTVKMQRFSAPALVLLAVDVDRGGV